MSRTNDVNIAMQYAKSGVDGVHLMDSHKATIGWVVNTLAAEVERLEAETARLRAHLQRLLDWGAEIDPHASEPAKVRYAADVATIKPALAETKEGKEA